MNRPMNYLRNKASLGTAFLLIFLALATTQCRKDDDLNYRIVIDNHCDFAVKVYYDNQEIENHEDGDDDYRVVGAVSIVMPQQEKTVYSRYASVWIEPVDQDHLKSRKFRSENDGVWHKIVQVFESDFDEK